MGRITTNIGLITGLPIADTVDKLILIEARPRELLVKRTERARAEQVAVTQLTALLIGVQSTAKKLAAAGNFNQRTLVSSNPEVLTARSTGETPLGTYQFTPLQLVQSHQLLSSGFASDTEPIGAGSVAFRFGGFLDEGVGLGLLGGGAGIDHGKIRITDRSGASAEIDLRFVKTVDEVLEAINSSTDLNVTAEAHGDAFRIRDNTGQTTSNLKIEEIGGGNTAASLGLADIDVDAAQVDGQDVLRLFGQLELDRLGDGGGVRFKSALPDLEVTFRDGSESLQIDFHRLPLLGDGGEESEEVEETPAEQPRRERTLADVIATINEAAPERLRAEISADGDRIVLTDLTEDLGGQFTVNSAFGSKTIEDLGLSGAAVDGVLTGARLLGGLKTSLVSSLNGGAGFDELGALVITDRSGTSDTVDLAGAETVQQIIERINAVNVGVQARINDARNGIRLTDTTGQTASNLIIASADDGRDTAEALALASDAAVKQVNSGDLRLQVVSEATRLDALNGGSGVGSGSFRVFDAAGRSGFVNLAATGAKTVGDVITEINRLGLQIDARINDTGDGILIASTASGGGSIRVARAAGTTAADLRIEGESKPVEIAGNVKQVIDGATTFRLEIDAEDTLEDLVAKINGLGAGVLAAKVNDGSAVNPFRVSLLSARSGKAGELLFDTSQIDFSVEETAAARDARLLLGAATANSSGVIVSSATNSFENVLPGISVDITDVSTSAVGVSVKSSNQNLLAGAKAFVEAYNALHTKLAELTRFDEVAQTAGVLLGDSSVLRVNAELSHLLSGRSFVSGSIRSLGEIGISLNETGKLNLDAEKLQAKFAQAPQDLELFFNDEQRGLAQQLQKTIDRLAGEGNSLLVNRAAALERRINTNLTKIEAFTDRLEVRRERLLLQFFRTETAIAKMQSNLDALAAIAPITPLGIGSVGGR